MNIVGNFDSGLNSILNEYVKKPTIIRGIVHLLLILYVARLAPTPPKAVLKLFENVYFKLFIFSLVLWTAQFSPSTSILIALAFMITVNYTTTGKVWEMMDNIGVTVQPVSIPTAVEAVQALVQAAASPEASSPTVVAPVANLAASAATTVEGVNAIKALAEQAVTPVAGTHANVTIAATTAIESIIPSTQVQVAAPVPVVPVAPVIVTEEQAIQAVHALADAAISEVPIPMKDVSPVVQIALSATSTQEGANAIKALGEQAITAQAGTVKNVNTAVQVAVESIKILDVISAAEPALKSEPATSMNQQSGCYPMRQYDMTKVSPQTDGKFSFEDYQPFVSSLQ
jgi:hypothetical protein